MGFGSCTSREPKWRRANKRFWTDYNCSSPGDLQKREIARLNVGYTEIRAPIDGYVGNRRARVGAYATAGSQLLTVVPASGLWVLGLLLGIDLISHGIAWLTFAWRGDVRAA